MVCIYLKCPDKTSYKFEASRKQMKIHWEKERETQPSSFHVQPCLYFIHRNHWGHTWIFIASATVIYHFYIFTFTLTHPVVWMTVEASRMIGQPLFSIPLCPQPFEGLQQTLILPILLYIIIMYILYHKKLQINFEIFNLTPHWSKSKHILKISDCDHKSWPLHQRDVDSPSFFCRHISGEIQWHEAGSHSDPVCWAAALPGCTAWRFSWPKPVGTKNNVNQLWLKPLTRRMISSHFAWIIFFHLLNLHSASQTNVYISNFGFKFDSVNIYGEKMSFLLKEFEQRYF